MMDRIRRAAVAGQWYPGEPARLEAEVERHLAAAGATEVPRAPCALVAPHAGLMYSGPVAAYAYTAVRDASYDSVVLVGPSHFVPFRGVSIWPSGSWQTPFGALEVDADRHFDSNAIADELRRVKALAKAQQGSSLLLSAGEQVIDLRVDPGLGQLSCPPTV